MNLMCLRAIAKTPILAGVAVGFMVALALIATYEVAFQAGMRSIPAVTVSNTTTVTTISSTTSTVVTTVTETDTTTVTSPINVVSAEVVPLAIVGPNGTTTYIYSGLGPTVELTLQNEAGYPLTSLSAMLMNVAAANPSGLYENVTYQFNVDSSHPLGQGQTVNASQTIPEGFINGSTPYTLVIEGTIQGQSTPFAETVTILIG